MRQRSRFLLSLVAAIAVSSSAYAQKKKGDDDGDGSRPKYTRKQEIKVNVKLNERTRPLVAKEGGKQQAAPALSADEILEVEGVVGEIREDQILLLQDLIDQTPDSEVDEKAELLFRLAEAYAQQQRYWRLRTQEFAIKADTVKKKSEQKEWKDKSEQAAKKAKAALLKAVDAYKKLASNDKYKSYSNMDKALFFFGYMLQSGRYMKEARSVYQRLIKEYPDSPYIPDAKVAFGDYYFEMAGQEPEKFEAHLENALDEYKAVLKFPKSNVYTYAMYKVGWVYLNLGRHNDALEIFYKVAELTKGDKKKEPLNRAAKKDLVRAYAEVGNVEKAYNYFTKVDKKFSFDMLQILGDTYLDQGKAEKAIYTFRELMAVNQKQVKDAKAKGLHKNFCLWQYNVAHAMLTAGNNAEKVEEIENLVNLYGALREKKVLPEAEAEECHDNAAAMAGDLARAYHNESMKTLNAETLAYADKLYNVYLKVFPDADDYGETQYYYAELLWSRAENEKKARVQTELWENAAIEFTNVVKHGKVEGKLLKESAYAAVLAWKNALAVDPRVKAPPPDLDPKGGKVPEAKEIPERELKMLAAFDVYIEYIKDPKDQELVGMKFLKANIYRRYNHFDKAIPIFEDIYRNHKSHETAEWSVNLMLDALNKSQQYDELIKWVDILLEDKKFIEGKDDLAERLGLIKNQSERKFAEALEKSCDETKDFSKCVECGEKYVDIYNRNPDAEGNDEVIYNAGVCFEKGKSIGVAIQMFEGLQQAYPKSAQAQKALARLGHNYANIAWYKQASTQFEKYAKKYGKEADAYDAMSDATFFRKGIGDDEQAIKNTYELIKLLKAKQSLKGKNKPSKEELAKDKETMADAFFSLVGIYEKQAAQGGDEDKVISHLNKYLKDYKGTSATRVVIAYTKIAEIQFKQSCKGGTVHGSCIKVERQRAVRAKKSKKKRRRGADVPTRCGGLEKVKITVKTRDEKLVKAAMKSAQSAIAAFDAVKGNTGGDERLARQYYARAKFLKAETLFEAYLGLRFPANLDFSMMNPTKAKKSKKRFDEWLKKRIELGGKAREKYDEIIFQVKDPSNGIAAAARIGQINQDMSDALFTAEIPKDVRESPYREEGPNGEVGTVDAYCDTLTEVADPLQGKSLEAFSTCLVKSTEFGWFSEWSKLCEYELGQIDPNLFPTASEIRAQPDALAPITTVEPALLVLPK